jgi:hypothetical protein
MRIQYRSVPFTQRGRPVRVVGSGGGHLGYSTHGTITLHDFAAFRDHEIELSSARRYFSLEHVARVVRLPVLLHAAAAFAVLSVANVAPLPRGVAVVALAILAVVYAVAYGRICDQVTSGHMRDRAERDRGDTKPLDVIPFEQWQQWVRQVDPYEVQGSQYVPSPRRG